MLSLFDPGTGQAEPLVPGHRGELRILSRGGPPGLAGLCDLLLPDLIRRTAEWHRLRVASAWAETGAWAGNGGGAAFRQAASALNLRPPDTDDLGPAADVCTGEGGAAAAGFWTRSGAVTFSADVGGTGPDPLAGLDGRGLDPLALRLVLLGRRYRDPLTVTWPALAAAGAELASWRGLVADWANLPSRPLSAAHRDGSPPRSTTTWTPRPHWRCCGTWRPTRRCRPAPGSRRSRTPTGSSGLTWCGTSAGPADRPACPSPASPPAVTQHPAAQQAHYATDRHRCALSADDSTAAPLLAWK